MPLMRQVQKPGPHWLLNTALALLGGKQRLFSSLSSSAMSTFRRLQLVALFFLYGQHIRVLCRGPSLISLHRYSSVFYWPSSYAVNALYPIRADSYFPSMLLWLKMRPGRRSLTP